MAETDKDKLTLGFVSIGGIFLSVLSLFIAVGLGGVLYFLITNHFNTTVQNYDICTLAPSSYGGVGLLKVAPSFWTAQVVFFFAYLIQNAISLYNEEPDPKAPYAKILNRRDQALTAAIVSSIVLVVLLILRYKITGCETGFGISVALLTMIPLGIGWYYLAEKAGIRSADIFGMAGQILPSQAYEPPPTTCVYDA
jgi:hypothetical protein